MNIKEAKTEIINTIRAYNKKDDLGCYTFPLVRQRPILLMGPPGIGILSGVGAKELVVSTLGVLYADDEEVDSVSLAERLNITPLVAFGYMLFTLIYFPCVATIVAIRQESGSWKWAIFAATYTTALAWIVSFLVYQIGKLFM